MGTQKSFIKLILAALFLGRVSNLPTVWTNVLTGTVICGGSLDSNTFLLMCSISSFYISGMYLNDAFDSEIDALERPERPIPAGLISKKTVFLAGLSLMMVGWSLLILLGYISPGISRWRVPAAGFLLATLIIIYNWKHKKNPLSPILMGLCRVLIYLIAALAVSITLPLKLYLACLVLFCYLIGLTYIAKQETVGNIQNLWPLIFLIYPFIFIFTLLETWDTGTIIYLGTLIWIVYSLTFLFQSKPNIPRVVVFLIAGICLLDGLLIAVQGQFSLAWLAVGGFFLTLAFQRYIPGT